MEKRLLPKADRKFGIGATAEGLLVLEAVFYESNGVPIWTTVMFSDFSDTLTNSDDLERLVINAVDGKTHHPHQPKENKGN